MRPNIGKHTPMANDRAKKGAGITKGKGITKGIAEKDRARMWCAECNQRTSYWCDECDVPLHLNTELNHSCWADWHTRSKKPTKKKNSQTAFFMHSCLRKQH